MSELIKKQRQKSEIAPEEFKLFDSRVDYQVQNKNDFEAISQRGDESEASDQPDDVGIESQDQRFLSGKQSDVKSLLHKAPVETIQESIKPDQFKIADDRINFEVDKDESDGFSITQQDQSESESSQAEGLWEYAQKFEGDEKINVPQDTKDNKNIVHKKENRKFDI